MAGKLKILVLDDEPPITKVLSRFLRSHGYEVFEVNNPLKVEEYLLYTDLSLLISDVNMPGMDGLEVLELVKKSKPELPVLILTGVSTIETAVQATKLGASEYLTKPINNESLLKAVRTHIQVDQAIPESVKELINESLAGEEDQALVESDKIMLKDEIASTNSIPDGLVEINFEDILPGQFLPFALYIQIYNKNTNRHYIRKISKENTVFTSGLKNILQQRRLASVFIREQDYSAFLEYYKAIKLSQSFQHQKIRDDKRLLVYGKAVEAVMDILTDPADNKNIKAAVDLVDDLFKTIVDDPVTYLDMFKLFKRDTTIFNHSANVCLLTVSFGIYLRLQAKTVNILGLGGLFHDVGMNRVDKRILERKGPLTKLEWDEIKKHPERGFALLKTSLIVPTPSLRIIMEHHEKEDGSGYPRGLKGDQVSKAAQICQIVDQYDSMTTTKPYRPAFRPAEALKRIYFEEPSETHRAVIRKFIEFLGGKDKTI